MTHLVQMNSVNEVLRSIRESLSERDVLVDLGAQRIKEMHFFCCRIKKGHEQIRHGLRHVGNEVDQRN